MSTMLYSLVMTYRDGLKDLSWDLKNINLWEKILDTDIETSHIPGNTMDLSIALFGQRQASPEKTEPPPPVDSKSQSKPKKEVVAEPIKDLRGDLEAYHWFLGLSWVPKLVIPVDNYVTRFVIQVKLPPQISVYQMHKYAFNLKIQFEV